MMQPQDLIMHRPHLNLTWGCFLPGGETRHVQDNNPCPRGYHPLALLSHPQRLQPCRAGWAQEDALFLSSQSSEPGAREPDWGLRRSVGPLVSSLMEEKEERWGSSQGVPLPSSAPQEVPGAATLTPGGPHETDSCPQANFWAEEGPSRSCTQECRCPWARRAPDGQGGKTQRQTRGRIISGAEAERPRQ